MGKSNSRVLLVEGIAGIGKSTLIDLLIRKHISEAEPRKIRSFLHLTQAHTYGPLAPDEDNNSLTKKQNLDHLSKIVDMLQWYVNKLREKDDRVKFSCIVDSLHITHCFRPGILSWGDVVDIDQQLAKIGCKLAFIQVDPKTIWDRTISLRKDNQFITHYGKKFGKTLEEIQEYFIDEQKKMVNLTQKSKMQIKIFPNDKEPVQVIDELYSFWKSA
ncbi:hypothetical protein ACFL0Y_04570 [Patescibacteria group bacterium]